MRIWHALLLALLAGALGLATENHPAEIAALALLGILVIGACYRLLLTGEIEGDRQIVASVIPWGGSLVETITLTNRSRVRLPSVRVVDYADLPRHPKGYAASLPPRRSLTWEVVVPCRERGRYAVGPIEATNGDPLGLFVTERVVEQGTSVLVLPRWVALTRCTFPLDGTLPGDLHGQRRGESPPAITGVRTYQPGDPVSRIHWHASARAGQLMTKQFDPEVQTTLWLALDLDGALPRDVEELLVTVTTSLGMYALQQEHVRVGLIASGTHPVILPPERDHAQHRRLQEMLAEVHAGGHKTSLAEQVATASRQVNPQHVVILLTGRDAGVWGMMLTQLQQRGVATRVAHVTERSRGDAWPVPALTVPVALADPALEDALITALEDGDNMGTGVA